MEDEKYDEQFITADMIKINMFNFFSLLKGSYFNLLL